MAILLQIKIIHLKIKDLDGKLKISNVVLLKRLANNTSILVYPNPSANLVNVALVNNSEKSTELLILNAKGTIVFSKSMSKMEAETQIDISQWTSGYYLMRFVNGNTQNFVKLLKN
jgi:Secretion system C-terminal sorting domain